MLRTKLFLAIAALLAVVFIMAALLFWGLEKMARQLDRSLLAHEQTEGYLRLAGDTYQHIWQLADHLIAEDAPGADERRASRAKVREQLSELERMTIAELGVVGDSEPEERQELLRIKQLADAIAAGIVAFNRVAELSPDAPERAERLDRLRQKIGRDFAVLIDEAIIDEREETDEADERVRRLASQLRWLAAMLATLATIIAFGLGYWLFHSIKRPIQQLLLGTRRIAAGDLDHRIALLGHDEFTHLANSFNLMAKDLERQHAALTQAHAGLEEKVRARTKELEQANMTLKRLDDVRRRMFADISHELRTPLTIINGEAEVTLRGKSEAIADYRTALSRIVDLTGQVAKLVEDLMLLARSDTAALQIRRRPVLASDVLRDSAEDLQALASTQEIEVLLQMPPKNDLMIDADPGRLAQLLLILVDNACRYSGKRSRITVSLEGRENVVLIAVADHGIGIPMEEREAVFDRYFRGERARHLAPKGAGLGLHVAKSIAEAHDGRLSIENSDGAGATVILTLPLLQQDQTTHANLAD